MAGMSRRGAIVGAAGVVAAAAAYKMWGLHQSLPPRDPGAEERFRRAQEVLLAGNGGKIQAGMANRC